MNNLALSQYRQGKADEAKKTLGEMIQYCEREIGAEHRLIKEAHRNLVTIDAAYPS